MLPSTDFCAGKGILLGRSPPWELHDKTGLLGTPSLFQHDIPSVNFDPLISLVLACEVNTCAWPVWELDQSSNLCCWLLHWPSLQQDQARVSNSKRRHSKTSRAPTCWRGRVFFCEECI